MADEETIFTGVRLPAKLRLKLEKTATEHRRNLTGEIIHALEQYIDGGAE